MRVAEISDARRLEIGERPEPVPGPGEVRVRIRACGICATDLHALADADLFPGHHIDSGTILGHEVSGVVDAVGPGVSGANPGDPVAIFPYQPCDECAECRAGRPYMCESPRMPFSSVGFAELCVVRGEMLAPLPAGMPVEHGALAEPLAVAVHAAARVATPPQRPILVLGGGPIGALTAFALRALGHGQVAIAEPQASRRELLERVGLKACPLEEIASAFGGEAPVAVIDCAGHPEALTRAVEAVASGGRILLVALPAGSVELPQLPLVMKEASVVTARDYTRAEYDQALDMLEAGTVPAERLITGRFELSEAQQAVEALRAAETPHLKVLIVS